MAFAQHPQYEMEDAKPLGSFRYQLRNRSFSLLDTDPA
jgi:hypothetical protein